MRQLRNKLIDLSRNRMFTGVVKSVINDKVTVDFGNGRVVRSIPLIGGPVSVGQSVQVDYISGSPMAFSIGQEQSVVTPQVATPRPKAAEVTLSGEPVGTLPAYAPILSCYLGDAPESYSTIAYPDSNKMGGIDNLGNLAALCTINACFPIRVSGIIEVSLAFWIETINVATDAFTIETNANLYGSNEVGYIITGNTTYVYANDVQYLCETDKVTLEWDEGSPQLLLCDFEYLATAGTPTIYFLGMIINWLE